MTAKRQEGTASMPRHRKAFTILELIIVIAIIAVLVGLVIVGMGGVRNSANRTESLNALRQMISGHISYSSEHRQHLMPGYVQSSMIDDDASNNSTIDLRVRIQGVDTNEPGNHLHQNDTASYVWRLAPYLDNAWRTMISDYRDRGLVGRLDEEYLDGVYGPADADGEQLGIALVPSFGLNSIFVGGDTSHGGDDVTDIHPWNHADGVDFTRTRRESDRLAATRFTQARNPGQLIVFGPVARADATADPEHHPYMEPASGTFIGYVELRAPYTQRDGDGAWTSQQWRIGVGGRIDEGSDIHWGSATKSGIGTGLPIVRWGTVEYPVANLDGSTTIEDIGALSMDMRRWSPFVTGVDPPEVE